MRRPDILSKASAPMNSNAYHFLASNAASYISGQTFAVDGGPHMGGITDT